tara:strand:+ start:4164 stop:4862 length:699 start_codon:yes stop_codon:yes gene_type:complete
MDYTKNIRTLVGNNTYNYGDAMYGRGPWRTLRKSLRNEDEFTGSFLNEYFLARGTSFKKKNAFDPDLVRSVFDKLSFSKKYKYDPDCLYIHLRAGDVLHVLQNHTNLTRQESKVLNTRFNNLNCINPMRICKFFEDHLGCCSKAVFVTASHFSYDVWSHSDAAEKNATLVLNNFLTSVKNCSKLPFGILEDVREFSDVEFIDYNFYVLCTAPHVILDQGGFSEVIKNYRSTK